jgi:hypothetical protein
MSFGQATPRQGEGWDGVVQGISAIFFIMRITANYPHPFKDFDSPDIVNALSQLNCDSTI